MKRRSNFVKFSTCHPIHNYFLATSENSAIICEYCSSDDDKIDWKRDDDEIVKACGQKSVLLEKD